MGSRPLACAKFHVYRLNVLPVRGEKAIFWPLRKCNTGIDALCAGLPVITSLVDINTNCHQKCWFSTIFIIRLKLKMQNYNRNNHFMPLFPVQPGWTGTRKHRMHLSHTLITTASVLLVSRLHWMGNQPNGPSPKRPQWRSKTAHWNQNCSDRNGPNGRKNKTKTAPANIQNGPFSCPKRPIT